ncbi:MAG: flagellar type III secretion system pore protein FliP [Isosphaeraceae bacterium]
MTRERRRIRARLPLAAIAALALLLGAGPSGDGPPREPARRATADALGNLLGTGSGLFRSAGPAKPEAAAEAATAPAAARPAPAADGRDSMRTLQTVALYSLVWLAPMGALMLTSFVRINIVLVLLRQALGSPQIPGNQVLTALALMLTALVMRPVGERVYTEAVVPLISGRATAWEAWTTGSRPIKVFMVDQIIKTRHQDYLWTLYRHASPPSAGSPTPEFAHEFPLRVVAPAFLLSELTTALVMGFMIYLPFLVVDLVVSAVLAAMGLYMLPPTLVAMPLKLIVFVLADGWMLTASMLLSSFDVAAH